MLIATIITAQKKVAVFNPKEDNTTGMSDIVREVFSTGLSNSDKYIPVERTMIDQVLKENKYQSSGMVDESKVSKLGKQMGADYVCVSIIKKMGNNYFVTAKLVDVTTATVILQKYVNTKNGKEDLFEKVEELSAKLFNRKSRTVKTNDSSKVKSGFVTIKTKFFGKPDFYLDDEKIENYAQGRMILSTNAIALRQYDKGFRLSKIGKIFLFIFSPVGIPLLIIGNKSINKSADTYNNSLRGLEKK